MKKNNMCRVLYVSLLAVGLTIAVSLFGETTNWVAINDHHKSTTLSSPYANFYNPLRDDAGLSGPLTNTVDYAVLGKGLRNNQWWFIFSKLNGCPECRDAGRGLVPSLC